MLEHFAGAGLRFISTLPYFDKFNSWLNQSSDNTLIDLEHRDNAVLINAHAT